MKRILLIMVILVTGFVLSSCDNYDYKKINKAYNGNMEDYDISWNWYLNNYSELELNDYDYSSIYQVGNMVSLKDLFALLEQMMSLSEQMTSLLGLPNNTDLFSLVEQMMQEEGMSTKDLKKKAAEMFIVTLHAEFETLTMNIPQKLLAEEKVHIGDVIFVRTKDDEGNDCMETKKMSFEENDCLKIKKLPLAITTKYQ